MDFNGSCLNCAAPLNGEYCAKCGQSAHVHRYTLAHIGHELFHSVTHTDRSALIFVKRVILYPGYVAKDLFAGKRKKDFSLFTFFLLAIALYTVAVESTDYYSHMRSQTIGKYGDSRMPAILKESFDMMSKNSKLVSFLFLPITAFLTFIFFRKGKYNFAEHLVFSTVIFSGYLVIMTVLVQLVWVNPKWVTPVNDLIQFVVVIYMIVASRQLFRENWFVTIVKIIALRFFQIAAIWLLFVTALLIWHAVRPAAIP